MIHRKCHKTQKYDSLYKYFCLLIGNAINSYLWKDTLTTRFRYQQSDVSSRNKTLHLAYCSRHTDSNRVKCLHLRWQVAGEPENFNLTFINSQTIDFFGSHTFKYRSAKLCCFCAKRALRTVRWCHIFKSFGQTSGSRRCSIAV